MVPFFSGGTIPCLAAACNRNISEAHLVKVFALAFVLVVSMNLAYLNMPPFWDAAPGTFSPAIYLYEHDTDLRSLLRQPGYIDGGPNNHSLGILSIVTFLVIKLTAGQRNYYLPILHFIQFGLAAMVLTYTWSICRRLFDYKSVATAAVVLLCFMPLFLVQASSLYTEVAGALFFLLWADAWGARRYICMTLYALLAFMTKEMGLVIIFVGFVLLCCDSTLSKRQRAAILWSSFIFAAGVFAAVMGRISVSQFAKSGIISFESVFTTLTQVPDLLALVVLSLTFPAAYLLSRLESRVNLMKTEMEALIKGDYCQRTWLAIAIVPSVFVFFLACIPGHLPLPRYYVWVLPFMIMITVRTLMLLSSFVAGPDSRETYSNNKTLFILIGWIAFSLFNRAGNFYPAGLSLTSFSIAERSFEYVDFYKAQHAGVRTLVENAVGNPVIVTRGEYYFLSSPLMGYVDSRPEKLGFILSPPYESGGLDDYPSEFLLLKVNSNHFQGGHLVDSIVRQALDSASHSVETLANHKFGNYESTVIRIRRNYNEGYAGACL